VNGVEESEDEQAYQRERSSRESVGNECGERIGHVAPCLGLTAPAKVRPLDLVGTRLE